MATKITDSPETLLCGSIGYIAPEMINKVGYGPKVDIFSCGIIMYVLMCGVSPFIASNKDKALDNNKRCIIEFPEKLWRYASEEGIELIKRMTDKNPDNRPTARECLNYKWFKNIHHKKSLNNVLLNLGKYKGYFVIILREAMLIENISFKKEKDLHFPELSPDIETNGQKNSPNIKKHNSSKDSVNFNLF